MPAGPPSSERNKAKRRISQREMREFRVAGQAAWRTMRAWMVMRERIRQRLKQGALVEDGTEVPHADIVDNDVPTAAELTEYLA
ncbi:MAG: hypothetical protein KGL59_12235 [Acidobacteriota bacterium]|nr:hypothetical protein [Acidobacteriota bacterium]